MRLAEDLVVITIMRAPVGHIQQKAAKTRVKSILTYRSKNHSLRIRIGRALETGIFACVYVALRQKRVEPAPDTRKTHFKLFCRLYERSSLYACSNASSGRYWL